MEAEKNIKKALSLTDPNQVSALRVVLVETETPGNLGAAARAMVPVLLERAPAYPWSDDYAPWPGPNSNTFAAWLSREVPGLWTEPYGAALGKDYPDNGWLQAGLTTTRTGVQLDTPYVGAQVGLAEGVELHLLGLTLGVDLWPPQVKLPFLPAIPWQLDG